MSNKESRLSRTNAKMVLNHIDELCRVPLLFSRNIFPQYIVVVAMGELLIYIIRDAWVQ